MNWIEFPAATFEEWEKKLAKELKDISPENLKKENEEGISIQFLYINQSETTVVSQKASWKIRQDFKIEEKTEIESALKNGVDLIFVKTDKKPEIEGSFLIENNQKIEGQKTVWFPSYENLSSGKWQDLNCNADYYGIHAAIYQDSGGNSIQALAFLFKEAIESPAINFIVQMAIGRNYFLEISKFRALRMLWKKFCPNKNLEIHAISSNYSKTVKDVHNNLIRNTLEAMSAILGTADVVSILPFDLRTKVSDEFSYRMVRNIQHLLREESYLNQVSDPTAGSYYIESLTQSIVNEVITKLDFYQTQSFKLMIQNNIIQDSIEENLNKRKKQLEDKKSILVGVNKFVNALDQTEELQIIKNEPINSEFKTLQTQFITQ